MDGLHARKRVVARAVGVGLMLGSLGALEGCDCDGAKQEMDQTAAQGFADAWQCCVVLHESDPEAGLECFEDLKEWRQSVSLLIIEWYQACLDGNQSTARQIFQSLRDLFRGGLAAKCGPLEPAAGGGYRTAGVPIAPDDTIRFDAHWLPVRPAKLGDPAEDDLAAFSLSGTFSLRSWAGPFAGDVEGELVVEARAGDAEQAVKRLRLECRVGGESIVLRTAPTDSESHLELTSDGLLLRARVSLDATGPLPVLLGPEAWIELPLTATGRGFDLPSGALALEAILPVAFGYADWDHDRFVTQGDRDAFYATPESGRDLDLNGWYDDEDERLFLESWRRATVR